MSQVTIYLEDDSLAAAKAAAARANVSLSKWFAQFAENEKARLTGDRRAFWHEVDRLRAAPESSSALDFLLDPQLRYADLGADAPRESWE